LLFNSYQYLLVFVPLAVIAYFAAARFFAAAGANAVLLVASVIFYAAWDVRFVPILLASASINWALLRLIGGAEGRMRRGWLTLALILNLAALGWYKYIDFLIAQWNWFAVVQVPLPSALLPLGISFFTFTQIAFLVDVYRRQAKPASALKYGLFVTFFPHLNAGPILHHAAMMPQFAVANRVPNAENVARGLILISIGLAKKVLIADPLALIANAGFASWQSLNMIDSWITALSYTFQLYFDFSGYCDIALGSALLLNINMPINFNSPYRATDLQDFWRRWHATLGNFFREYIYIPLGGNRAGSIRALVLALFVFVIGGFWHGANWTFVLWGASHGVGVALVMLWRRVDKPLPSALGWFLTFVFAVQCWVLFRAPSVDIAMHMLGKMWLLPLGSLSLSQEFTPANPAWSFVFQSTQWTLMSIATRAANFIAIALIPVALVLALLPRNSQTIALESPLTLRRALLCASFLVVSLMFLGRASEFIYFIF
jgi:alginate O-acetyltransferase complex protein AlgI